MVRNAVLVVFLSLFGGPLAAQYSISYQWMNFICGSNINCDEGCSACDEPEGTSGMFFGTNMVWVGTSVCPHPVDPADNALYSSDWPVFPDEDHYGLLSGIALTEVRIDSVVIVHRREVAGPQRLKVSFTPDLAQPALEVADVEVATEFSTTVLTDLGCLTVPEGMPYAAFQLMVQPYQSEGGNWHLDGVRVVASPCANLSTGIPEYQVDDQQSGSWTDVLGRPVNGFPSAGVYLGGKRQVRVF